MDLQTVFYSLGIIFYVLSILILLGIGVGVFMVYRKINQIYKEVDDKIKLVKSIAADPSELAANMGAAVAHTAIGKLMNRKKSNGHRSAQR